MNFLVINQPLNNRGDESAHRALIRSFLKEVPDCSIRVLFVNRAEKTQYEVLDERVHYVFLHTFMRYSKVAEVALHKPVREFLWDIHPATRQIKAQYMWADVVVCAPGGICMGGFQDWNHLYFLKWAKHCHKPLAYYGRSFGPFPTETKDNRLFKSISYEILHYFSFLSIRDKVTERLANEIGVPYVSTVDTAFLDNPDVHIPYEIRSVIGAQPYMVFVPNYLLWHYAYKGKFTMQELVDFYCEMLHIVWKYNPQLNVVMLPQTFGNGNMVDDINLFRIIAEQVNDSRVILTADCYSSDIQQCIIRNADFLIGARYHSVVFAINQNTPFIALSYEHKISGLLEALDKKDCMVDFTQTMLSAEGKQNCLSEVERMLPLLEKDEHAQQQAKSIAQYGMDQFLKQLCSK